MDATLPPLSFLAGGSSSNPPRDVDPGWDPLASGASSTDASADAIVDIGLWKLPVIAALLLVPVAVSAAARLRLARPLLVAAGRCALQMALLGGVLRVLLTNSTQLHWTALYVAFMMAVAALEAGSRPSMSYNVRPPL